MVSNKTCIPKNAKYINVKVFNIIANKTEAKVITRHNLCDFKCKLNSAICISNQKWNDW